MSLAIESCLNKAKRANVFSLVGGLIMHALASDCRCVPKGLSVGSVQNESMSGTSLSPSELR